MYSLIPDSDSAESISKKFSIFFEQEKADCLLQNDSYKCPKEWWYLSCVTLANNITTASQVQCPFYNLKTDIMCINGTWNLSPKQLFVNCNGNLFLFRNTITNIVYKSLLPVLLLIFMTSTFKLYEYDEISQEFQWKIIIWMFIFKSVSTITGIVLASLNSSNFIYHLCMLIVTFSMYGEYFTICSMFVQCFYLYAIVNYMHTQLRIIKSALNHIMFISPIILIVIGLIFDVTFTKGRTFQCKDEPMSSPIQFLYVYICISGIVSMIYMRVKINYSLHYLNISTNHTTVYRVEYDIIGRRKEISHRDIQRLLYILKIIICITGINILVNVFALATKYPYVSVYYYKFTVILYSFKDLTFVVLAVKVVWLNPTLKSLTTALERWYQDIDLKKTLDDYGNDEFFAALKVATDDESSETSLLKNKSK
uniref:GCR136 n=1 Tax=Schmidtea mediterranea TaxID=79327 RepID=A0A193KUM8_SCHMD|nr:GCR136 [Schmidtea mediterranea]